MKVVLDLTRLLQDGKITQAEYDRLSQFAARDTGSLAINLLIGLGVIAVAGGLLALLPSVFTAAAVGAALLATGLVMLHRGSKQWEMLATICVLVGALMLGGGLIAFEKGSVRAILFATIVFAGAGIAARSGLLIAAAVIALAGANGARTAYWHATYALGIDHPTETIVLFSALALVTYQLSKHLPSDYARLSTMAARTSVLLVNFGFWIGSLWGERLTGQVFVPRWFFAIAWAVAIAVTGAWAVRANRRWVVNVAAIFGAIHFYTQWFERLGATPMSVLLGGFLVLAFAMGLWKYNQRGDAA